MSRWRVLVLVLSLAACTKPNPRSCADGTCTDPAFPFCDVGGELEGTPQTCIAVACDPGTFEGCRGDLALTCNSAGSDFDLIECERGCDDGIGCRLCEPNETACTNGTVATCDANGVVAASEACPLGCFENEPRCREIDPSNGLATFIDTIGNAPDVELENAVFDSTDGTIRTTAETLVPPTFFVAGVQGNPDVRVYVVNKLKITGDVAAGTGHAIAILAKSDIEIAAGAHLRVGRLVRDTADCLGGPAAFIDGDPSSVSGSGGGGFATRGGAGGSVTGKVTGGAGGGESGNAELVPLRGGCSAGGVHQNGRTENDPVTPAGGALQLVSRTRIEIHGVINGDGEIGDVDQVTSDGAVFYGGGAGGGILLEAPVVAVDPSGAVLARGGYGGTGVASLLPLDSASFMPAPTCTAPCIQGGDGAGPTHNATNGATIPFSPSFASVAGGGGGGLGRIRVNTQEPFDLSVGNLAGSITKGPVSTR